MEPSHSAIARIQHHATDISDLCSATQLDLRLRSSELYALVHRARFRKLLEISIMLQKSQIYAQLLNLTYDLGAQCCLPLSCGSKIMLPDVARTICSQPRQTLQPPEIPQDDACITP